LGEGGEAKGRESSFHDFELFGTNTGTGWRPWEQMDGRLLKAVGP
jgi:hypothetical protein